jgi:hypothetical protein
MFLQKRSFSKNLIFTTLAMLVVLTMRYRAPKKESDFFSMIEHQQSVLKAVKGINKLNAVIDWELFRDDLESILGYDDRDPKRGGRPPFDAVLMLKVLVLQKYYGLRGQRGLPDVEGLPELHSVQRTSGPSAQRTGAGDEQTQESYPRSLRACLRADEPDGDGSIMNHRPAPGRATQRTL